MPTPIWIYAGEGVPHEHPGSSLVTFLEANRTPLWPLRGQVFDFKRAQVPLTYLTTGWSRWLSRAEVYNIVTPRGNPSLRTQLFVVYQDHLSNGQVKIALFQFTRRQDNASWARHWTYGANTAPFWAIPNWASTTHPVPEDVPKSQGWLTTTQVKPIVRASVWDKLALDED